MWILRSTDKSNQRTLRLTPGSQKSVGRDQRANFVVDAALISRMHCHLSASTAQLFVEDLKSTNGTFVNDQRIQHSQLRVGDRLRLGRLELYVSKE